MEGVGKRHGGGGVGRRGIAYARFTPLADLLSHFFRHCRACSKATNVIITNESWYIFSSERNEKDGIFRLCRRGTKKNTENTNQSVNTALINYKQCRNVGYTN